MYGYGWYGFYISDRVPYTYTTVSTDTNHLDNKISRRIICLLADWPVGTDTDGIVCVSRIVIWGWFLLMLLISLLTFITRYDEDINGRGFFFFFLDYSL